LPGILRGEMFVAVAVADERVAGFGHALPGEVLAIYVAPEWSGQGLGRKLLAEGVRRARRAHPGAVRVDATMNAQGFYRRAGFVLVESKLVQRSDVQLPVVVMELRDELPQR
jgi:ribosomal protein S18 acetylase RimI-like enzyme